MHRRIRQASRAVVAEVRREPHRNRHARLGGGQRTTIDQMAAQRSIAAGSLACADPFAAGAADVVAGSVSAVQIDQFGELAP